MAVYNGIPPVGDASWQYTGSTTITLDSSTSATNNTGYVLYPNHTVVYEPPAPKPKVLTPEEWLDEQVERMLVKI